MRIQIGHVEYMDFKVKTIFIMTKPEATLILTLQHVTFVFGELGLSCFSTTRKANYVLIFRL